MSKPTRTELVRVRDETYRPFVPPEKRCQTCVHYHSWATASASGNCTIPIRSNSNHKDVHAYAECGSHEARP